MDLTDRRTTALTGPTGGAPTQTLVRHYTDTSDNPAWTETTTGTGTAVTRYVEDLSGNLGATISADGSAAIPVTTVHGDTVTTITIAATQAETIAATGCDGWADYTEYGAPRAGSTTATVAGPVGYGWLGGKQRSTTTESAGLTLMGDRFYNPTRRAFTSLDPEPGGNDTAYSYPNDPINKYDLDGHMWGWARRAGKWASKNREKLFAMLAIPRLACAWWQRQAHAQWPGPWLLDFLHLTAPTSL